MLRPQRVSTSSGKMSVSQQVSELCDIFSKIFWAMTVEISFAQESQKHQKVFKRKCSLSGHIDFRETEMSTKFASPTRPRRDGVACGETVDQEVSE